MTSIDFARDSIHLHKSLTNIKDSRFQGDLQFCTDENVSSAAADYLCSQCVCVQGKASPLHPRRGMNAGDAFGLGPSPVALGKAASGRQLLG